MMTAGLNNGLSKTGVVNICVFARRQKLKSWIKCHTEPDYVTFCFQPAFNEMEN